MTLVYAGTCCHAPGMTSRAEMAAPELGNNFMMLLRVNDRRSLIQEQKRLSWCPPNTLPIFLWITCLLTL